jgi:hypothetical protein
MISGDWETFRYVCSLGLLESVVSFNNFQDTRLCKTVSQLILEASQLCAKYVDLSLFMTICLKPLRRLLNVSHAEESLLIESLSNLMNEDILVSSHLTYIICREGLLNCIVAYFGKHVRSSPLEALRAITLAYKISSIR